ncbi:hypothetical protein [Methylobacterium bullatum]|uniref:Uncharacterized protein n=1 Tax=Methylobacterium bullatum TaxID=570505 RepID=A0AAV4ZCE9_9HYPH|nr:hypothetical protein [Methylobacterium bullatum]GJD41304.1 hypothetical protein OICFNHDK_3787 [Methylobacterium bullatum]
MPRMPETLAALQRGQTVRVARLVQLDFATQTKLLHQGAGPLRTADGRIWSGIGELGQISDIDRAVVPTGGSPTLTLSGVEPDLIAKTLAASAEVKGRPVRIYDQHYTETGGNIVLADVPLAIYSGLMDRISIADQGATATISVVTVTLLYNRRRPAFGYLNPASQERLHPGDGGCRQIARLTQANEKFPTY